MKYLTSTKSLTLVVWLVAVMLLAGGCFHKQLLYSLYDLENFEEERQLFDDIPYDGQAISIGNYAGKINIIGIEPGFVTVSPFVSIEAVKKVNNIPMEDVDIEIDVDGSKIAIATDLQVNRMGQFFKWTPPFVEERLGIVEYTISVPKDAEIEITQELGEIHISNFEGHLDIRQAVGKLIVENSHIKTINLEQETGDVSVINTKIKSNAHLKTSVGNIYFELFGDDSIRVDAKTSLSEISIQGLEKFESIDTEKGSAWPGQELKIWIGRAERQLTLNVGVGEIELVILESLMEQNL